jgi:hypothetical protein
MTNHTAREQHDRHRAVRVQVCDGCCCGTERKHPGIDHASIRNRIAAAAELAGGHMRVVDCVDECSQSNVVIVRPADDASNRIWIGAVLDEVTVEALCEWIAVGATAAMPSEVEARVFLRGDRPSVAPPAEITPVELRAGR